MIRCKKKDKTGKTLQELSVAFIFTLKWEGRILVFRKKSRPASLFLQPVNRGSESFETILDLSHTIYKFQIREEGWHGTSSWSLP
ncbi:hypothetical protein [Peribacillus simplex]|uniref:hypothetical protein n=1 Tax=Peribacillus simplex TaxID=1478 RepID=UPI003D08C3EE